MFRADFIFGFDVQISADFPDAMACAIDDPECQNAAAIGESGDRLLNELGLVGVGHARNMSALPTNGKDYFRHCRFIFSAYGLPMSFADQLADYTAAQIIAAIGCPRGTAYDWKDGRREPPAWQQELFLAVIAKEAKKHNKTLMPTDPSRAAGSRKRKS